jgi:hypothetical protein
MADTSIFSSLFEAAKKLPAQVIGGGVDLTNVALGGFANIADIVQGKPITREIGEGLVKKPIGGTEHLNDVFGISNASSGLLEDSTGAVLNVLTPSGAVTGATKAIIGAAVVLKSPKMIEVAEAALKAGTSPEQVFKYTGIYKGPVDNSLKAVIDDSTSKLNLANVTRTTPLGNTRVLDQVGPENPVFSMSLNGTKTLPEVLDHPELYKKYPELLETTVSGGAGMNSANHSAELNHIQVGSFNSAQTLQSALLHETQHAIQTIEGFSQGASAIHFLPGQTEFFTSLNKVKGAALEYKIKAGQEIGITPEMVEKYATILQSSAPKQLKDSDTFKMYLRTRNAQTVANTVQRDAYESYKKVGGEAEARAVQRMFEERTGPSFPLTSYDTPISELTQSPLSKVLPKTNP